MRVVALTFWGRLLPLVIGVLIVQTGSAQVIEHTVSIGPVDMWQDPPFQLPQFDSSIGTLTGVTIEYFAPLSASYTGQNTSGSTRTITDTFFGYFTITGPGFNQIRQDFSLSGSATVQPGQVISFNFNPTTLIGGPVSLSADRWDGYRGTGTVSLNSKLVASDTVTPSSAAAVMNDRIDYQLSATVTVNYSYTPVPEPHLGTVSTGLALLVVSIWRCFRHRIR